MAERKELHRCSRSCCCLSKWRRQRGTKSSWRPVNLYSNEAGWSSGSREDNMEEKWRRCRILHLPSHSWIWLSEGGLYPTMFLSLNGSVMKLNSTITLHTPYTDALYFEIIKCFFNYLFSLNEMHVTLFNEFIDTMIFEWMYSEIKSSGKSYIKSILTSSMVNQLWNEELTFE